MNYVYVKDSEGFVVKKASEEVADDEVIISKSEYKALSGEDYYEKHFSRGGKRIGAGRKTKFSTPLKYQIRVTQQEKDFINMARANNFDFATTRIPLAKR
ncbi:MAG: hypothetical protein SPJ89_10140 [Treponema sp.]|nr:hypothetical protein [Spirochaetia bacterium]MDD7458599.1 hypothetical protein [Spirochaetales bacterium]MDY5812326.1 hypothetical protein [Treponema sp.]